MNTAAKNTDTASSSSLNNLSDMTYIHLKWIAIITMVLDHLIIFLARYFPIDEYTYTAFRSLGRIAFPLFAFLLVESFYFTKSKWKHLLRIGYIAILSEFPFDVFMHGRYFKWQNQNVCVTLFLGFLMLIICNLKIEKTITKHLPRLKDKTKFIAVLKAAWKIVFIGLFCICGELVCCDYSSVGILFIGLLDLSRSEKFRCIKTFIAFLIFILCNVTASLYRVFSILAFIIIVVALRKPNNCKLIGFNFLSKKFFAFLARYFYPIHLLLFAILSVIIY